MRRALVTVAGMLTMLSLAAAAETLDAFGYHWSVPVASDWKVEQLDRSQILSLVTARGPLPGPRRPIQFAIAGTTEFSSVIVDADARVLGRSLIIVFAYIDEAHFDYAHFSTDTGTKEPVHNGIFHVYGGERVRISSPEGPASFAESKTWNHIQLTFDGATGAISGKVNGQPVPSLQAVDKSLNRGRAGIGSFDETAQFRNVKIRSGRQASE